MKNKELIIKRVGRIESELRKLNYTIGVNDRPTSYQHLDKIKEELSNILTHLNRETQD